MRGDSAEGVWFGDELFGSPGPFCEGTASDPYFHVMYVAIVELAPES